MDTPVTLPPGRPRLATSPAATGSLPTVNTIGIDAVACSSCNSRSGPSRNETMELIQRLGGLPRLFCTTDLGDTVIFCLTIEQQLSFNLPSRCYAVTSRVTPRRNSASTTF
jgi:hypothetical protein